METMEASGDKESAAVNSIGYGKRGFEIFKNL